jgi:hypothetical protein
MRLRVKAMPPRHEHRLQEIRWERKTEKQQMERLSATLVKKVKSGGAKLSVEPAA